MSKVSCQVSVRWFKKLWTAEKWGNVGLENKEAGWHSTLLQTQKVLQYQTPDNTPQTHTLEPDKIIGKYKHVFLGYKRINTVFTVSQN